MRFYVLAIQYNREKEAENRTVPKAYDTKDDAIAEWHSQLAKDMKNDTLGWSLCMVIDVFGNVIAKERWTRAVEPTPEEDIAE